ncbi:MAG: hypothetical protein EOO88_34860 [Pedobacter sp.]|nr:MAG: hypothetical protein EOO88_34860 [Pedobacter sp.]
MKTIIFIFVLLLVAVTEAFAQSSDKMSSDEIVLACGYDTAKIAVIKFTPAFSDRFPAEVSPVYLNCTDFRWIDTLVVRAINTHNFHMENWLQQARGIDSSSLNYKRQYLAVVTLNGEKLVWANFLCSVYHFDWKKVALDVADGGKCYFNVLLNLITMSFSPLSVNGSAFTPAHHRSFAEAGACWLRPVK